MERSRTYVAVQRAEEKFREKDRDRVFISTQTEEERQKIVERELRLKLVQNIQELAQGSSKMIVSFIMNHGSVSSFIFLSLSLSRNLPCV